MLQKSYIYRKRASHALAYALATVYLGSTRLRSSESALIWVRKSLDATGIQMEAVSRAVLSCGAVYYAVQGASNF